MHLRSLTACCLGGLLLALAATSFGCRRRDPYMDAYIEILNAEKRDMEDHIQELEGELEQTRSDLEAARSRTPRTKTTPPGSRLLPGAAPKPKVMEEADLTPPMIDDGVPMEPKIELPAGSDPVPAKPPVRRPAPPTRTMKPAALQPAPMAESKLEPEPMLETKLEPEPMTDGGADEFPPPELPSAVAPKKAPPASEALPPPKTKTEVPFRKKLPADVEAIDPQVSRLFINPFHTTGIDLDQHPGDDALRVLIEPRNELGQFIPQAGEVSVVLLDPAKTGDAARIARWDLNKQRVGEGLLEARPDRGIKLDLPWPERAPDNGKLKLFVRYTGADGQTIETTSDVFVSVAGQLSQRWTPAKK